VQQAHQNGITGKDVEVGIIDKGFDPQNPAIASNVAETRSFRSSEADPTHGTSTAEIVTRTAPDAQLSLVSVSTATDIEAAIGYLRRQDVDVIVHSQGVPSFEDDGEHILTDNINTATDSGTLFVNAAGNEAQTHWEGNFRDTDEDDLHEWTASGDERNALPDSNSDFSGGEVAVIVRWENHGDSSDYKPYLLNPVTEEYIVEGQSGLRTETNQYARISADVAQQPLSVVIENTQGPANDEIEVSVFEGPREIQRNIPASSITAPGDVPAALAVAAYEVGPRRLAPYSSRGPTDNGRTGIDVTGYTNIEVTDGIFGGTSAAAPYAGGVAALVEENQPGDQSPTELTSTLKSASDDILDLGTDTASGAGVVNAADAVDLGVTQEQEFRLDVTVADDDGTQVKSAVIPDGGQRNVQVRVTARPIDAASGTPFAPVAGQDVTLELTDRTAGELGVGDSTTPEVTVTTTDTGIATTTFRSAVTRSQGTNVTASTRNGDGELFETDSVRGQNLNNDSDQAEINIAGTLTGDIRDGDGELIRNRPVNVLLAKNGNEIENTTIDQGQYNFENLETGDQYRVTATFQGESGSATIESLSPGTNTRDIVIADITVGGITSSDVTLSDSTPSPGSNVTVTVTATPENGNVGFNFNHLFNQSVATASAPTAQIGGISVDPIASSAGQNAATVTLGADDVTAGEQITIEYTITTAETAGQTVSLTGSVTMTNGDTQDQEQELPEISYTTTDTDTDPKDTGAITGTIRRVDGSEIENVEQLKIRILQDGVEVTGDPPNSPVQADPTGEYTAEVPVEGTQTEYRVEVSSPRFVEFAREVTIQPQATERVDIRLQESSTSTSAIDATRSLTSTEVTNGSTVTVTVSATFESSIDNAKLVDTVTGEGISADNLTITQSAGAAFRAVTSDPQPAVDITWNSQLGGPLGSDSVTVEYEVQLPEDTPVGTTITFDGTVTNSATSETAGIDGDSSVEVVATTGPDTVTVGGQEVPTEFTSETNNGNRTVTADNAVEAINTFIGGDVSADVAVDVINAFIAS
jgi:hypothetical protein